MNGHPPVSKKIIKTKDITIPLSIAGFVIMSGLFYYLMENSFVFHNVLPNAKIWPRPRPVEMASPRLLESFKGQGRLGTYTLVQDDSVKTDSATYIRAFGDSDRAVTSRFAVYSSGTYRFYSLIVRPKCKFIMKGKVELGKLLYSVDATLDLSQKEVEHCVSSVVTAIDKDISENKS
jgi:hypothetical protein